ncbi:hypothetical protein FZEAL_4792 [Fusarium zealandicum]|uniref:Uncharacterized protein n=1 Tax=Fusarium zealandicum TaxID=1053134 RepID=A0A8H4ULS9_9HYPO|nr:hypothetical protein FZEAL_4792 [Fusarium zealandicum]
MDSDSETLDFELSGTSSPNTLSHGSNWSFATSDTGDSNDHHVQSSNNGQDKDVPIWTHLPVIPREEPPHLRRFLLLSQDLTPQAHRVLRRSRLTRRSLLQRQITRGRGDPSQTWCSDSSCFEDGQIFRNPFVYLVDRQRSRLSFPVDDYFKDFANAMVGKLFPAVKDPKAKDYKALGLLSFVDSPPVRTAFWKFTRTCLIRDMKPSDANFQAALVKARPEFQDLMFGVKTAARTRKVHSFIDPQEHELNEEWTMHDFMLRFLICSELWRQHKTPRSGSWVLGSRERVADFLSAVLYNLRLMWLDGCFDKDIVHTDECWDRVWQDWLDKYPVQTTAEDGTCEVFEHRDRLEKTEDEVLREVGYLGGVGEHDGSYRPVRRMLGEHEWMLLSFS